MSIITTILDVETSGRFDINNLHVGTSWTTLVFPRWTDKTKTTTEDYPDGEYRMEIFTNREYKGTPAMTLEEGAGLTIAGNLLTITRSATENTLKAAQYYYRVLCEVDANTIHRIIHGVLNVDY